MKQELLKLHCLDTLKIKKKILDTLADKFFSLIIGFENKNILTEVEFKNELIKFLINLFQEDQFKENCLKFFFTSECIEKINF